LLCRNFNALPRSGGLDDQDYVEMNQANTLENIYHTLLSYRRQQLDADQRKTVSWLAKMGLM
jgi:hypothetical protein